MRKNFKRVKYTDENTQNYYVQDDQGTTYTLDKKTLLEPLNPDDTGIGFTYTDRNDIRRITLTPPEALQESYSWGTVVSKMDRLGLFVDIGLIDKEVVVSLDELPEEVMAWPEKDSRLLVTVSMDNKERLWAHMITANELEALRKVAPPRLMNQDIHVRIIEDKRVGVIGLSDEGYEVFIHESEMLDPLTVGEYTSARVIDVHKNGKLNASTKPRAHEALDDDARMIEAILSRSKDQFLPLHDKSPSEEIREQLGISKSQFKRAVGRLMKENIVKQIHGEGIYLIGRDLVE